MRIFRFHSYKKVQSFSEKEKLYMDDVRFVWNFLSYQDNARTRESRQQSSARTALGPSRPQRLTCSRRRTYIPATVLFGGGSMERKLLLFSNIQLPTCRHWGARG